MIEQNEALAAYLDNSGRNDRMSGGVKMISIRTPKGTFRVWTKRVGNNPRMKVLLLHGGPGATHEYLEAFDSYFPAAGIEYYYYDQLGSTYSDQPDEPDLWEISRFVDEVEQVRQGARTGSRELLPVRSVLGRSSGHGVCLRAPGASEGAHHLQHDGQRSRVR